MTFLVFYDETFIEVRELTQDLLKTFNAGDIFILRWNADHFEELDLASIKDQQWKLVRISSW